MPHPWFAAASADLSRLVEGFLPGAGFSSEPGSLLSDLLSLPGMLLQEGQGQAQESPFNTFLPLIIIVVIFWLLVFRPESRKRKEREKKIQAVQKGDQVVTTGGILGKVVKVEDRLVVLQIDKDKDVRVQILKTSIFEVLKDGEATPAEKPSS